MTRLSGLSHEETTRLIPPDTILLGYRGSIAHGTYIPQHDPQSIDDKDLLGVCIAPLDVYFGLKHFEQREVFLREWDSVVYELRKFIRLLTSCNPNVMSLLWLERHHYLTITPLGQRLIDQRQLFISKAAHRAFTGYAYGQLKRMTHFKFEGYMGEKRKALVEKFGYETKNAAHLIRLLRMGIELLREGRLHVFRHDNQDLIEIKRGKYSLEKIQEMAEILFRRADEAYDASPLPAEPDTERINTLTVELLTTHFKQTEPASSRTPALFRRFLRSIRIAS